MADPNSPDSANAGKPAGDPPDGKARFLRDCIEYKDDNFVGYSVTIMLPDGVSFRDTEMWGNKLAAFANTLDDAGDF